MSRNPALPLAPGEKPLTLEELRSEIRKGMNGPFVDGPTSLMKAKEYLRQKAQEQQSVQVASKVRTA